MPIQADQLLTFALVARFGSVTRAAEHLHRSQPAVSVQLRQLSEAVGEILYLRHRYGITLTPAGEALLPYAHMLSQALTGARDVASEFGRLERGKLSVTASMTNAVYVLPRALSRFHACHPKIELELLTRNTHEAITLLQRGEAAAAFVEGPLTGVPDEVERRVVGEDELVLITRPDHPLAGRQRVALGDLEGLAVVEREPGSGTREVVERALRQAGIKVSISLEATGIEAIKEAVLEGLGAGFISKLAVRREVATGLLVSYPLGPSFSRPLTLLHPPLKLCSQATRMFLASLDTTEPGGDADGSPKLPQVT